MPVSLDQMGLMWSEEQLDDLSPRGWDVWMCIPGIICWSIWSLRNSCAFEDSIPEIQKLPDSALSLLVFWLSHLPDFVSIKFNDWVFE